MGNIDYMSAASGRVIREDGTTINFGSVIAPIPNGDQVILTTAGGINSLNPPLPDSTRAIVRNTSDSWMRFNTNPEVNVGINCPSGNNITLESPEEIKSIRILSVASGTMFVQYFK